MNIGVYGGAFNPPHVGHTDSARTACEALGLDRLLVVPSAASPHKPRSALTPGDEDRLNMLRCAFDGIDGIEISDIELKKSGLSYTSQTLRALHSLYPDDRLFFIMGSDMLLSFEKWHEPEVIASYADLAYLNRGDVDEKLERCERRLQERFNANVIRIENRFIDVSSTRIRRILPLGCGENALPADVYAYIREHGLYDTDGPAEGFEQLRAWSLRRVGEKRGAHVLGCEEAAAKLAERWGADKTEARTAAVLHDLTKAAREAEQLQLCGKYGIIPDEVEKKEAKLLHGKTAAAVAADILKQPESICAAIRYHTTGRPGMTLLEKIICLADYIEPGRDFEGVERLRALAYDNLDIALEAALSATLADIIAADGNVHPRTEQTLGWLRALRKDENLEIIR